MEILLFIFTFFDFLPLRANLERNFTHFGAYHRSNLISHKFSKICGYTVKKNTGAHVQPNFHIRSSFFRDSSDWRNEVPKINISSRNLQRKSQATGAHRIEIWKKTNDRTVAHRLRKAFSVRTKRRDSTTTSIILPTLGPLLPRRGLFVCG